MAKKNQDEGNSWGFLCVCVYFAGLICLLFLIFRGKLNHGLGLCMQKPNKMTLGDLKVDLMLGSCPIGDERRGKDDEYDR